MALGPGSIAFTGFNADGVDNISFVVLEEIPAGTDIHITDDEWSGAAFNTGESKFTWTAAGTIAAGTIITIDNVSGAATSNLGTVAFTDPANKGLAAGGDTLYAYVGKPTVPTAFLAAIASNGFTGATTTGLLDNTGLALATHAIDLGAITGGLDIGAYNGSRSGQANLSDYLSLINNVANWIGQNADGDQNIDGTPPDAPFSTAPFSAGATQTVGFAAGSTALSIAEGGAGTIVFTFTVERTGGTTGQVDYSGTFGLGGTNAADYGGAAPVGFSGTILDGTSSGEVTVTVSGDLDPESDETFTLTLTTATNPSSATVLGSAAATGTILNDDGTVLSAGDIAFTGFNADGSDNIAFVVTTDIEAGTEIRFSDNEWSGTAFNTGESMFVWSAGGDIAAGTVVTIDTINSAVPISNLGTVVYPVAGNAGLSNGGDTLYAFVGSEASPTFVAAIASAGFTSASTTGLLDNTGLTLGTHAINLGALSTSVDIGAYVGSRSGQATASDYLTSINDTANWIAQDASGDQHEDGTAPDLPFDTTAFTVLDAGSIAFTGFNADGLDNLAFVVLADIAAGATIHFTDNEWSGTAFNTGESAFSWTASSGIAAGTIVTIDNVSDEASVTSNLGTVVYTDAFNLGISNSDEVIYAYVGTPGAPTAFLAAIANDGFVANGTLANTGLTVGTTALDLTPTDQDADVAAYIGSRVGEASLAGYLPIINHAANWITQDAGGDQSADATPPDVPFSTTVFVVGNPQIIGFAAGSVALSIAEGNAGTTTFTFTVERTGGTLGQVDFSGTIDPGNTDDDDFGGTTPISFSGTILDGAASGIVEVNVSGDTVFEAGEQFTLTLTSATNPDEDVSLGANTATGTIVNDDAAPSVIANGETVSAMITLTGTDTLTIENGGTLDVPALGNPAAVKILGPATAVVLDNSGLINSGSSRTIDAEFAAQDGNATIFNRATGVITQDAANQDRVIEISGTMTPGTVFTINNEGQIIAPERAIDTNGLTGDFVLNNCAGGIIESAAGFEAFRGTGVVNNWGIIRERVEGLTFDQAAIDFQSHAGGVVNNMTGGLIEGSRHGITGDLPVTLTNEAGATVRGRNGSGINLDTTASDPIALVTNRGLISGNYNGGGDGDGDGVDVDGLLTLHNYGRVEGTGADNVANFADGVAAGGGEIYNYAGGVIFGESRGILIDDSNLGAAFAAALIVNEGTIGASLGPAIRMIGDWNDSIINSGRINGDVDMGGGADVFDASTGKAVVGTVMGGAGIDTLTGSKFADTFDGGDGNDTLTGNGGNDVLGGGGDSDTINGGKGNDQIDGGTGNDTLAGNEGSDTINGGDGSDCIDGGAGTDQLLGGIGEDTILGAGGNDVIDGGDDADALSGEEGKDSLTGGGGNDGIDGGAGNDSLAGGEGDDTLDGGQGMDILTGGIGRDTLTGGVGADHFVFGPGDFVAGPPFDEITDFKHAQKDKIDLSSIDAVSGGGDDAFSFVVAGAFTGVAGQLHYVAGVGQVTVQGDINGDAVADFSITVLGVASLVSGDFIA